MAESDYEYQLRVGKINLPQNGTQEKKRARLTELRQKIAAAQAAAAGQREKERVEEEMMRGLEVSGPKAALIGIGRGYTTAAEGVGQFFRSGQRQQDYTREAQNEMDLYRSTPAGQSGWGRAGEVVGEAAPYMAIPAKGVVGGMAAGGLQGILSFVPEGNTRFGNAFTGAAVGTTVPMVLGGGAKVANTIAGRLATPAMRDVQQLGQRFRVRTSAGDVSQDPLIETAETALEKAPGIGMTGFRKAQSTEARKAAEDYMARLDPGVTGDWAQSAQRSLDVNFNKIKTVTRKLYAAASQEAGSLEILPSNTYRQLRDLAKRERQQINPDEALINRLEAWQQNILAGGNTFDRMTAFQDDLQEAIRAHYKGANGAIGARGVTELQKVKQAIDSDVLGSSIPARAKSLWQRADAETASRLAPYRERDMIRLMEASDPTEITRVFNSMVRGKPQTVYENLTPLGRDAVKYGIMKEAFDEATEKAVTGVPISPKKLANALKAKQDAIGVFFKGADKEEMDGFIKLMDHIQRAGQFKENPPTGWRALFAQAATLLPAAAGGAAATGGASLGVTAAAAAAGATPVTLMRVLFGTEAGKRFLLASNKIETGSPKFDSLLNQYAPALARSAAVSGTEQARRRSAE